MIKKIVNKCKGNGYLKDCRNCKYSNIYIFNAVCMCSINRKFIDYPVLHATICNKYDTRKGVIKEECKIIDLEERRK